MTACSSTCATQMQPDEQLDAGDRAARRRRAPDAHPGHARRRRPRPDLLPGGVRGRGRRLGAGDQPFDQPNVQEAKDNTKRVLESGSIPELGRRRRRRAARAAGRRRAAALRGDHGLPAATRTSSTPPSPSCATPIRAATGAATTFGYGPRFLHSTGQLHKGGPPDRALPAARQRPASATSRSPGAATRSAR